MQAGPRLPIGQTDPQAIHASTVLFALSLPVCALLCTLRIVCFILHDLQENEPKKTKGGEPEQRIIPSRCWCCDVPLAATMLENNHCHNCGVLVYDLKRARGVFDECVFRGPCRACGRYGRATSLFTASMIIYCIVENVRVLLPTVLAIVGPQSTTALGLTALSWYLSCMTPFNFLATIYTPPGHVSGNEASARLQAALAASGGEQPIAQPLLGWRRCADSGLAMPPRAAFCRRCKRATLRMDHHCAFVNTCVGHANHHYFLRLLAAALVSTSCECLSCLWVLTASPEVLQSVLPGLVLGTTPWSGVKGLYAHIHARALIALCLVSGLVAVAVGVLLFTQLSALMGGHTFAEAQRLGGDGTPLGHVQSAAAACEPRRVCDNLRSVFGGCLLMHFLPLPCAPVGDGFESGQPRRPALKGL